MRAVRRGLGTTGDEFPEQVEELRQYFEPERAPFPPLVRAYPGENQNVPIWLLGSSGFSAKLAAELGLPFAFASHFSPDFTLPALDIYLVKLISDILFSNGDTIANNIGERVCNETGYIGKGS